MEILERTVKEASSFFQNFFSYDVVGGKFLQNLDPRVKMPGLFALVLASVTTFAPEKLFILFICLSIIITASRIPLKTYSQRVWMIPIFSFFVLSPYILADLEYILLFSFRVFLAVSFLTLFMLSTRFGDIVYTLRFYRIPDILVTVFTLTYQYIILMFSELYRILLARESRKVKNESFSEIWRNGGAAVGSFFIRSFERAERMHLASLARGSKTPSKYYGHRLRFGLIEGSFVTIVFATLLTYIFI